MIAAARRLISLLNFSRHKMARRHTASNLDMLVSALRARRVEQSVQQNIFQLNAFERWVLLAKVLENAPHMLIQFVHVPKTGGTTLASALSSDSRFIVISVDGGADSFVKQLRKVLSDTHRKVVFVRAHHSLSLSADSGVSDLRSMAFTTLRAPGAIHASNANMIVRRIGKLVTDKAQSAEDAEYASRWMAVMHGRYENSARFALEILSTPEYRREMAGVYAKIFDVSDWRQSVKKGNLLCFDKDDLDDLFADAFAYSQPPSRRNVSKDGPLDADQIPSSLTQNLLERDQEIYEYLSAHRADAITAAERLRALLGDCPRV